jgi:hypothetical protein
MPIIPVLCACAIAYRLRGGFIFACPPALVIGYNGKRQIFFRAVIDAIQAGYCAVILRLKNGFFGAGHARAVRIK